MSSGLGSLNGQLIGQFAASIAPIYVTFILGLGYCFADVLKLDFVPAISVIIQYVCLPALLFLRIATNDPSNLDLKLLGADALSKAIPLTLLLIWWGFFSKLGKVQSLEWVVTFWMLATLPNTVLIGDQILTPMFTDEVKGTIENKTTTIIFAQSLYWYNCVILLFEIREMFIEDELAMHPPPPIDIDPMLAEENLTEFEKQQRMLALGEEMEKSRTSWDGRPSSVWEPNRPSSVVWEAHRPSSVWEPNRPSITWEQHRMSVDAARPSWEIGRPSWSKAPYDFEMNDYSIGSYTPHSMTPRSMNTPSRIMTPGPYMTPGRMTPLQYRFTPSRIIGLDREHPMNSVPQTPTYLDRDNSVRSITTPRTPRKATIEENEQSVSVGTEAGLVPTEFDPEKASTVDPVLQPSKGNKFKWIGKMMIKVVRRMLQVPLLYGSVLGFVWSINRWRVPSFLKNSAELCAEQTVGLAMILLGMVCYKFYKGERGFVPCGQKLLWAGFALRFVFAPVVMYVCALAFGIKHYLLDYAILQVIVPQGSMTFALAQIYGCKLEVITPAIYIQMIVFVPFIIADFAFLSNV
ncbi:unnamed protein product [Calypogeia fissa]